MIENPLDTARLLTVPRQARVLLVGSGLTALDVMSTLLRQGHDGPIAVISRRGLRPRAQPKATGLATPPTGRQNLDRLLGAAPDFMTRAAPTARGWLKALRARICENRERGETWHPAFDDLRDAVWQLWPGLPADQKRRFLRQLRPWYDVHRFRSPPQTEAIVAAAQASGLVTYRAARLRAIESGGQAGPLTVHLAPARSGLVQTETFDVVVNCTGLDVASRTAANPLLQTLVGQGWLRPDDCGVGYAVDAQCRALGAGGAAREAVRLIGPPTLGTFGDPGGAMFIAAQIHRLLPDLYRFLAAIKPAPATRQVDDLSLA